MKKFSCLLTIFCAFVTNICFGGDISQIKLTNWKGDTYAVWNIVSKYDYGDSSDAHLVCTTGANGVDDGVYVGRYASKLKTNTFEKKFLHGQCGNMTEPPIVPSANNNNGWNPTKGDSFGRFWVRTMDQCSGNPANCQNIGSADKICSNSKIYVVDSSYYIYASKSALCRACQKGYLFANKDFVNFPEGTFAACIPGNDEYCHIQKGECALELKLDCFRAAFDSGDRISWDGKKRQCICSDVNNVKYKWNNKTKRCEAAGGNNNNKKDPKKDKPDPNQKKDDKGKATKNCNDGDKWYNNGSVKETRQCKDVSLYDGYRKDSEVSTGSECNLVCVHRATDDITDFRWRIKSCPSGTNKSMTTDNNLTPKEYIQKCVKSSCDKYKEHKNRYNCCRAGTTTTWDGEPENGTCTCVDKNKQWDIEQGKCVKKQNVKTCEEMYKGNNEAIACCNASDVADLNTAGKCECKDKNKKWNYNQNTKTGTCETVEVVVEDECVKKHGNNTEAVACCKLGKEWKNNTCDCGTNQKWEYNSNEKTGKCIEKTVVDECVKKHGSNAEAVACCKLGKEWKNNTCDCGTNQKWEYNQTDKTGACKSTTNVNNTDEHGPCTYRFNMDVQCNNGNRYTAYKEYTLDEDKVKKFGSCDEAKRQIQGLEDLMDQDANAVTEYQEIIKLICGSNAVSVMSGRVADEKKVENAQKTIKTFFANAKENASVWKTEEGNFNGSRLASDLTAGVVLGTVGGVVSANVIKKNQIEKGFDVLHCTIGGQAVAGWGDEFTVQGGIR